MSDLLLSFLVLPFSLAKELMGFWPFGEFICNLWLSIDVLLCTASIWAIVAIALGEYRVVLGRINPPRGLWHFSGARPSSPLSFQKPVNFLVNLPCMHSFKIGVSSPLSFFSFFFFSILFIFHTFLFFPFLFIGGDGGSGARPPKA